MASERLTFPGTDGQTLAARLDVPVGEPHGYALFAHCFTCSKDILAAGRIAQTLCERGFAVLRFDFTGLGESEGDFADTNFSSNVGDLVAAADFLRDRYRAPSVLIGHSLGGAAVLLAAARVPECVAVVTVGAPADPSHVAQHLEPARPEIEAEGAACVNLAGRPFTIKKQFLDDLSEHNMEQAISSLGRALLIMHAPRDQIVGIDNASKIFMAAKHPKSFISLDTADHLLSRKADAEFAATMIAAWAQRYLDDAQAEPALPKASAGEVVVVGRDSLRQRIATSDHEFVSDEPASVGGANTGPTPYDLLLASLGACTSMTLRMYANRKGWPLDSVTVRLTHDRQHKRDCEECEDKTSYIDYLRKRVTVEGELDDAQRKRLHEIADRCPVHRTLLGDLRIESQFD